MVENLNTGLPKPKLDFGPQNLLLAHHDLNIERGVIKP
jgi:hypothetical protein